MAPLGEEDLTSFPKLRVLAGYYFYLESNMQYSLELGLESGCSSRSSAWDVFASMMMLLNLDQELVKITQTLTHMLSTLLVSISKSTFTTIEILEISITLMLHRLKEIFRGGETTQILPPQLTEDTRVSLPRLPLEMQQLVDP